MATKRPNDPHRHHKPTDLTIRVTKSAGGEYKHEAQGKWDQMIRLPRRSGPYRLVFALDVPGLEFDQSKPFLCDVTNGACPTRLDEKQFEVESCTDKMLTVWDSNSNSYIADYNFKLNFADGAPPYDPVIQNGGGIKGPGGFKNFAVAVGFAVAGAAAVALIGHFAGLWNLW
jgi:hypothetical protein